MLPKYPERKRITFLKKNVYMYASASGIFLRIPVPLCTSKLVCAPLSYDVA